MFENLCFSFFFWSVLKRKFQERLGDKKLPTEMRETFDEGIEQLMSATKLAGTDVERTKQYLDWISSLPWFVFCFFSVCVFLNA